MDMTEWIMLAGAMAGVIVTGVVVWRRRVSGLVDRRTPSKLGRDRDTKGATKLPTYYSSMWPFGELSFEDVIERRVDFGVSIETTLQNDLNRRCWALGVGDVGNIIVQAIAKAKDGSFTVTFSEEGKKLLKIGSARIMNGALPVLVDSKGKIIEIARMAPSTILSVATITSAVVSVAHLISSADLANRIKEIEKNVEWLIALRKIDQWATLERIFYSARELCLSPINDQKRAELQRMRHELHELRIKLRREMEERLSQVVRERSSLDHLLSDNWLDNLPVIGKRVRTGKQKVRLNDNNLPVIGEWVKTEKQRLNKFLTDHKPHAVMIEFALRLEYVLAMAGCAEREFLTSLRDELNRLDAVLRLVDQKTTALQSTHELPPLFNNVVQTYRRLLNEPCFSMPAALPADTRNRSS